MKKIFLISLNILLSTPLMADIKMDNFTSGKMNHMEIKCKHADHSIKASVPGGNRWVRLQINENCQAGNPSSQTVSANLRPGRLVVNNGYEVRSRTEIHYGRTHKDRKFPMNLDLTEGTGKLGYLEVTFAGANSGINLNVVAHANNGKYYGSCGINVPPNSKAFTVAFPLKKFRLAPGMRTKDFQDIDFLGVILQTANGNFGIKEIKSTLRPKRSAVTAKC